MCFGERQAANVVGALRFVQGLAHWRTTAQQSEIAAAINGPTCCSLEAKQFNDFSRAGVGVCVSGRGAPASRHRVGWRVSATTNNRSNDGFPLPRHLRIN